MGTDMAPTYATLTMGNHELESHEICQINWGRAFRNYIEENWHRILDDCEVLLDSKKMVQFLDVLIRKEQSIIWTDLYIKPADTRRYLPF